MSPARNSLSLLRLLTVVAGLLPALGVRAQAPGPRLGIERLPEGPSRLEWSVPEGHASVVQTSTNLAEWSVLATIPSGGAAGTFLVEEVATQGQQFYRVRFDPPDPGSDAVRHLVGLAGYQVGDAGMAFANGPMLSAYRHLMAVDPRRPDLAVRVVEGGSFGGDAENFIHQNSIVEAVVDSATGQFSRLGIRYTVLARAGRFWKLDHRSATAPVPEAWTTLAVSNICSGSYTLRRVVHDFADASKSWVFFASPVSQGGCTAFPEDVRHLGLRLDMGAEDAPIEVPRPVCAVYGPEGGIRGFVVQQGPDLVRVDLAFENPVPLYSLPGPHPEINGRPLIASLSRGVLFGPARPGVWLFPAVHQLQTEVLHGVDLAGTSPAAPLFRLPTETASPDGNALFTHRTEADARSLYLAPRWGVSTSSIVRIDPDLSHRTLAGLNARIEELTLTETHVVVRDGRNIRAVSKEGGELRLLGTLPATEEFVSHGRVRWAVRGIEGATLRWRALLPAGENVWFEGVTTTSPKQNQIHVVGTGVGGERVSFPARSLVTWVAPPTIPWTSDPAAHTLYVADQRVPKLTPPTDLRTDFAGMPVRAVRGATREEAFLVGAMPSPTNRVGSTVGVAPVNKTLLLGDPLQYGQPGLIPVLGRPTTPTGGLAGVDLLLFRSDAPGLEPATRYGID